MKKTKVAYIDPDDSGLPNDENHIEINLNVQEFDGEMAYIESMDDISDKTMAYMEKIIRKSYEYRQYINYLKNELDITKCILVPTLDINEMTFSLEFHHYPLSLYDITTIILNKQLTEKQDNEKVSMFDVMEEVMKEHYEGNVGLVPLTSTMHEMAHSGSIKIPYTAIYGNYENFLVKYKKYMTPELLNKVETALSINDFIAKDFNEKLNKKTLDYNINYNKLENKKEDEE